MTDQGFAQFAGIDRGGVGGYLSVRLLVQCLCAALWACSARLESRRWNRIGTLDTPQ